MAKIGHIFKNTRSVLYFMTVKDLTDTIDDLFTSTCNDSQNSIDVFSILSVYLFVGEQDCNFSDIEEALKKWFRNLDSERQESVRSSPDKATTQESLATRLKYYFLGTSLGPLLLTYPKSLQQIGPEIGKSITVLVNFMQTDLPNDSHKFVPLVYSLFSGIKEVNYKEGLSNYLASSEVD
jgi:hypothetical protein